MPKSTRPAYSRFLTYLEVERTDAANELESLQINTRNGDRMMRLAAICETADHYEAILTDRSNADLSDGFRACKAQLMEDLLHDARYPKASTSPMANLMWQMRNSVRAEFLKTMIRYEEDEA